MVSLTNNNVMQYVADNKKYVQPSFLDAGPVEIGLHALREGNKILAQGGSATTGWDDVGNDPVFAFLQARG